MDDLSRGIAFAITLSGTRNTDELRRSSDVWGSCLDRVCVFSMKEL